MVNWDTATNKEICEEMSRVLEGFRGSSLGYFSPTFIMPESTYRLLSLEKRMTRIRKGPGKGRNRIVHVMRRG